MPKLLSRLIALFLVPCLLQESIHAVIPAKAGIQSTRLWTPAFAGVTSQKFASQALAAPFVGTGGSQPLEDSRIRSGEITILGMRPHKRVKALLVSAPLLLSLVTGLVQLSNKFLSDQVGEQTGFFIISLSGFLFSVLGLSSGFLIRIADLSPRETRPTRYNARQKMLFAGIILFGQCLAPLLYFLAMEDTSLQVQSATYVLYPLLTLLGARLLFKFKKETLQPKAWVGITVMMLGYFVFALSMPKTPSSAHGIMLLLGSVVSLTIQKMLHIGLLQDTGNRIHNRWLSFWGMAAGTATAFVGMAMQREFTIIHTIQMLGWPEFLITYAGIIMALGLVAYTLHYLRNRVMQDFSSAAIFPYVGFSILAATFGEALLNLFWPDSFSLVRFAPIFFLATAFILWGGSLLSRGLAQPSASSTPLPGLFNGTWRSGLKLLIGALILSSLLPVINAIRVPPFFRATFAMTDVRNVVQNAGLSDAPVMHALSPREPTELTGRPYSFYIQEGSRTDGSSRAFLVSVQPDHPIDQIPPDFNAGLSLTMFNVPRLRDRLRHPDRPIDRVVLQYLSRYGRQVDSFDVADFREVFVWLLQKSHQDLLRTIGSQADELEASLSKLSEYSSDWDDSIPGGLSYEQARNCQFLEALYPKAIKSSDNYAANIFEVFPIGSTIVLHDSQGKPDPVRITGYLDGTGTVMKGIDTNKDRVVIKRVEVKEAVMNAQLAGDLVALPAGPFKDTLSQSLVLGRQMTGPAFHAQQSTLYLLTPFISGRSFDTFFVETARPYDASLRSRYMLDRTIDLCKLLSTFYRFGYVQEVLHGGNIMLTGDSAHTALRLLDFGDVAPLKSMGQVRQNLDQLQYGFLKELIPIGYAQSPMNEIYRRLESGYYWRKAGQGNQGDAIQPAEASAIMDALAADLQALRDGRPLRDVPRQLAQRQIERFFREDIHHRKAIDYQYIWFGPDISDDHLRLISFPDSQEGLLQVAHPISLEAMRNLQIENELRVGSHEVLGTALAEDFWMFFARHVVVAFNPDENPWLMNPAGQKEFLDAFNRSLSSTYLNRTPPGAPSYEDGTWVNMRRPWFRFVAVRNGEAGPRAAIEQGTGFRNSNSFLEKRLLGAS